MRASILALTLLFASCATPFDLEPVKSVRPGETVTLRILESARIESEEILVQFAEVVEDSRCPEGVTCVWEGNAEIRLRVTGTGETSAELSLGSQRNRTARFEGMEIELVSLRPVPREGVALRQSDYEATLRVTEE